MKSNCEGNLNNILVFMQINYGAQEFLKEKCWIVEKIRKNSTVANCLQIEWI